eukprot:Gb_37981 [translate_table: standard]
MSSHSAQQQSTSTVTDTSEIVKSHVKFAADTMDKISSEGDKLQHDKGNLVSRFPGELKRVVSDAMKGLGNLHWIAVGFSVIAFVLETMVKVSSNVDKAFKPVHTIVEGAIICCSYTEERKIFRYFTVTTMEESLKETRTKLSELTQQLGLMVGMDIQKQIPHREEQLPTEILQIQPVGIDREARKVMELLDMENRGGVARAVIIYGFGGIGKTMLAEYVVSKLQLKLSVVRMDERNLNTKRLQEKILLEGKGTRLRSLEELKATLEEEDKEKLKTIKGIWIDEERLISRWWSNEIISDFSIESEMLDLMSNSLRVLALICGIRVDGMCQRKFENLMYLQLGEQFVDFPFKNGLQRFDKLT